MGRSLKADPLLDTWEFVAVTTGSQVCRTDPELWFGDNSGDMAQARMACGPCPFFDECRLEGLVNNAQGMWGGLSFAERRRWTRKARQEEIKRLRLLLAQRRWRLPLPQRTKGVA